MAPVRVKGSFTQQAVPCSAFKKLLSTLNFLTTFHTVQFLTPFNTSSTSATSWSKISDILYSVLVLKMESDDDDAGNIPSALSQDDRTAGLEDLAVLRQSLAGEQEPEAIKLAKKENPEEADASGKATERGTLGDWYVLC